jgi:hypothetical protein
LVFLQIQVPFVLYWRWWIQHLFCIHLIAWFPYLPHLNYTIVMCVILENIRCETTVTWVKSKWFVWLLSIDKTTQHHLDL